ncbi:ATP-binding protein [Bosea sp. LjRoot9]|uniref:ATP-binding protein n=1 Tax=Bosea sp. LjRoot9 TaxID=3342341 RepID=UPI003ED0FBB4
MRLWPRSLAGQFIAVLLPALMLSQLLGFIVTSDERISAIRSEARDEFLVRTESVARALRATPSQYHGAILTTMATNTSRFWLSGARQDDPGPWREEAWRRLQEPLTTSTGAPPQPASFEPNLVSAARLKTGWEPLPPELFPSAPSSARMLELDRYFGAGATVELPGGVWPNAAFGKPYYGRTWLSQSLIALSSTAILLSILTVWLARRITRPMRKLAAAADALGRGEETAELVEQGPEDVRRMAGAFNRMQDRLRRFILDRTAMLAAIGHDLRTPITSLRLRAEFVRDPVERERFMASLDEMQAMTEATLSFAGEQAVGEATRLVDLAALIESICSDLADLGRDVDFRDHGREPYRCRPAALGRAIRNIVENAARYGERARVALARSPGWIEIVVEDDGDGIPESEFERVFAPFVRLEASRSRETGGTGLGLAIARTIVRSHGGDVLLANRERGLRVTIRLPEVVAADLAAARSVDKVWAAAK